MTNDRADNTDKTAEFRVGVSSCLLGEEVIELHEVAYVDRQTYLTPHPREMALRNHV